MKNERIKVIILNKVRGIQITYIDNTLKAMQNVVEGLIEYTSYKPLYEKGIELIVNEEGRLLDLPETLLIHDERLNAINVLHGNVIITKTEDTEEGRENVSLTREDIAYVCDNLGTLLIADKEDELEKILGLKVA